jgi:uncharacterized protein (TIGR04255 family)
MTTKPKAPLVEAIFEFRWGETSPGNFAYAETDRTVFVPKFSSAAGISGFIEIESINSINSMPFPMQISHRFRKKPNVWPCYQIGLGIFTVNQVEGGYKWCEFRDSIEEGLKIFQSSDSTRLDRVKDSAKLRLLYQDLIFPGDSLNINELLSERLGVEVNFPKRFLSSNNFGEVEGLSLNFAVKTKIPDGKVIISLNHVLANHEPAYLIETIVESSVRSLESNDIDNIMSWVEQSHNIQKHSYKNLILGGE